jgi:hypothetical protein
MLKCRSVTQQLAYAIRPCTRLVSSPQYLYISAIPKIEHKGVDFISDLLIFHDVSKEDANNIHKFLRSFWMGMYSIRSDL